jgi:UDP-3-O-[3-hydroxymyristoyl] N-acetylglucosamine deacetylase/3-hydroxyacyl-[acyl-carrier-protein] dehydratase
MRAPSQRTIAREVTLEGCGVHLGEAATLTFRAAEPDTGIRFRRIDLDGSPEVPAGLDHVVDTDLGTSLACGEAKVLTVEHVMAALGALEIDNVVLDLTGPEIPIRDGSFQDYFRALSDAGPVEQDAEARVISIGEPVTTDGDEGQSYVATKGSGLRVSATIDFEHDAIGRRFGSFSAAAGAFAIELAPARTFGFKADSEELRARGLALGASLENTVVLDDDGVMNDGLRFEDEFLRHKVGDIVGDLALIGARINAHVVAERPSHSGNVALAHAIARQGRHAVRRPVIDITRIMEYLPHRYPMLLVDRITEYEEGKRIVGIKNVTINEPFFQGHYPGHPVMPGVLVIEAMAQVGGLLLIDQVENSEEKVVYFMSLNNVKWRRPVTPGDTIVFELELTQHRRDVCKMRGCAYVDGKLAAEADLMASIVSE